MQRENKEIIFNEDARKKLLSGAKKAYEALKQAYGPQSGNVLIEKNYGDAILTHDGISIIREIYLMDPVENMGARMLVQASKQTNDTAGDGTSVTVILAYHIIETAIKRISAGYNAMGIRRGILKASQDIIKEVKRISEDVKDRLSEVAIVSCGDEAIGRLIAETIEKVGDNGNVTVEESKEIMGVEREIVEGFYFKKGYANAYMVTNQDRMVAELKKPYILVTEKKLTKISDIFELLKQINDEGRRPGESLLIVGDISGDALTLVIANKLNKAVITVAVGSPIIGEQSSLALEDIAVYTGAKLITASDNMEELTIDDLGRAESAFIDSESTTIIKGAGNEDSIKDRIKGLRNAIKEEKNTLRKERMEDRLARLSGKVGVIKVGGATETEMFETKDRVDDAVCATRAAKEEGIVPGGGTTLLGISSRSLCEDIMDEDEEIGYTVTMDALEEPFRQLINNSFGDAGFYLKQLRNKPFGMGYNVKHSDSVVDMKKEGVIDATKVVRMAVENACSIAANFITTNCAIAFEKKDEPKSN